MELREASATELDDWVALRQALWPDHVSTELRAEAEHILSATNAICFLAFDSDNGVVGFIEGALYQGANGHYGHVEGWYVDPEFRRRGLGRRLVSQLEQWCLHRNIRTLTSDTDPRFPLSPKNHVGAGFRVLGEMTIFIKNLK
jgi:aminoglycoside 6'-N-acetyltransferase I